MSDGREALRRAEIGLRLSPYDVLVYRSYAVVGLAHYAAGDYAEAAVWGRRSASLNPRFMGNMRFLAASLAASGKIGEAQQTGSNILSVDPKFSAGRFSERHAFKDAAQRRLFREHLVKAGLPD